MSGGGSGEDLAALTVPEVRRLLWLVLWSGAPALGCVVGWSVWRRRHQRRAQVCHHRKRGAQPPTQLRL